MVSRVAVVAAFIAGAALVAACLVVSDTAGPKTQNSLSEKLAMLKNLRSAAAHKSHFLSGLDTACETKIMPNGRCPTPPGDPSFYIQQDGCCYARHVCYLPSEIWCTKGPDACAMPKRKPGSEAGVNYKDGWSLPQGCSSTCEDNGQECG